ncbi:MAG: hypothetical protein DRR42_10650 [Gammaproteobacteria bacterium]|nr:MAG: hypothetical protein DRR42_10650 [Gammaproteobacteria bacterium]
MNTQIDLSGEEDVYANVQSDSQSDFDTTHHEIRVISDPMPTALARIFGLLSTMSVIPSSSTSSLNADGTIKLKLHLSNVAPLKIDLLRRKICQLTDTVTVFNEQLDDDHDH